MMVRRNLYVAWLALTLNALAPIFAYAHIHIGANGEIIEYCAADEPGDTDTQHQHSQSGKGTVPQCPYCAGFAAGVSLASGGLRLAPQVEIWAPLVRPLDAVRSGRTSVRIAQQRAPPSFS
jgi:hypothetical protein